VSARFSNRQRFLARGFVSVVAAGVLAGSAAFSCARARQNQQAALPILKYIASGWDTLTRSMDRCNTLEDPKVSAPSVLYLPAGFSTPDAVAGLPKRCNVRIERLPMTIHGPGEADPNRITPAGLLYLEHPYVVPGGRFNEMYGWDSYFIIRGLVRDGRVELARGMVENFLFEIAEYGGVLNANRTYYLTRSQPPFLTSMILAVYDAEKARGRDNRAWLAKAYPYAAKDHQLWTKAPHLAGSTGLSRYYDFGNGPAPESVKDEPDYYAKVARFFAGHPELQDGFLVKKGAENDAAAASELTADYFKGDRAMRESGFDISFRFAPYGAATHRFAPVCLNSLLYKTEKDLEQISAILGRAAEAGKWRERAATRKEEIIRYLWDDERGLFFDFDFEKGQRSTYDYVTTFYPLWAGLATKEQSVALEKNLALFEQPGGLATSRRESGVQWDYPFAWAPLQLLAAEGLRRYGFGEDADRITFKFLSMVRENYDREQTIREKYNAVTRSSEVQVSAGYRQNVVGFGWTNGVFVTLLDELPAERARRLGESGPRSSAP
jgi:alpha,alpha-trehalase